MSTVLQSAVRIAVGLAAGSVFTLKLAPHLFPVKLCKNITEWKSAKNPGDAPTSVPVPSRCQQQLKEVLHKLGMAKDEKKIKLFICNGYSPTSAGATWLPNGAVIGLPKYVLFEREEDIEASGLTFKQRSVNWKSKLAGKLKRSLLANDSNLSFLIAHELAHIQGSDVVFDAPIAPIWLYATYKLTMSTQKFLRRGPKFLDAVLKVGICGMSFVSYSITMRAIRYQREYSADEKAATIDLGFALGGVDCMMKRLTLNTVLRVLYGEDGKRLYSEKGESLKNNSHPKITDRLRRLEKITADKLKEVGIAPEVIGGPVNITIKDE
ncbi:predicted protein [Nematostella vectensis]|uniref:Peptidase M48 domain-containing protein n=1 Tax=Nematostella vectensis TaxID=45351 RepID=A7RL22_NEMVE|nr:transmembrane protein 177 [Nematostella vectensis]EDO47780.1 predicted protein [Nematostella vectensis]|eukprot:XP_001639843.1 predicted protein [Nematostella vectensis]